jgi:hypothetical protein
MLNDRRIRISDYWIRIRIWISDLQNVNFFFSRYFCLLFEGTFSVHNFSKIKSQKEVTKQYGTVGINIFLTISA